MNGVYKFKNMVNTDYRGTFEEIYNADRGISVLGYEVPLVMFPNGIRQVSRATSFRNVGRGMHFQPMMNKIIRVTKGTARFFFMNVNPFSNEFGKMETYKGVTLHSDTFAIQSFIAVGYHTLENDTTIEYLQSETFNEAISFSINGNWDEGVTISEKDRNAMTLEEWRSFRTSKGYGK